MKSISMRIQKRTQRRTFLRPDRSLCSEWRSDRSLRSEWRSDRSLRSEWKQAKKSPTCFRQKSRARFIALPVAKSRSKVFEFLKNCGVCIGVGHRRSGGWSFLTSVVANYDFLFRISRHCVDQAFCGYELE
ncbi:hypothetical protein F2Q69_00042641 [Brassica cretica]|uniref:Uncharacterized protein n=1 Tax=Brassica cretica TaxID=69181 RepID=A0A8S9NBS3_BRACR|nr:hypothetical protein F2Q69_00042641 [Brassica cretica]